jgi:very-short-patch-repair endonuclease
MSKNLDLRDLQLQTSLESLIPFELLEKTYHEQSSLFNQKYPQATVKTMRENVFVGLLRKHSRLEYRRSYWITGYNVDFFFPALALVIEIDGKVHDQEFKSKVDHSKINKLFKLGISVSSIENFDFNEPTVSNLLEGLKFLPRLYARSRKRLLRKIYLATLTHFLSDSALEYVFGEESLHIFSFIRRRL